MSNTRYFAKSTWLLRRQQWATDSTETAAKRVIFGEAVFRSPIQARVDGAPGKARAIHVTRFEAYCVLKTEADIEAPAAFEGRLLAAAHPEVQALVQSEMVVGLPRPLFDELWAACGQDDLEWSMTLGTAEDGQQLAISEAGRYASVPVFVKSLRSVQRMELLDEWVVARREQHVRDALQNLYFPRASNLQVQLICNELARGVACANDEETRVRQLLGVSELIAEARTAFRLPLAGTGEPYNDNAYALDTLAFEKFVEPFDVKRQDELKATYNQLWRHFVLTDVVRRGEDEDGPRKSGFACFQESLDPVAQKYMALGAVRSQTLEVLLLDALVFGEGLGFAQHVLSQQNALGMTIAAPIKVKSAWAQLREDTLRSIWSAASEVVKLALTYAVAHVLTEGNIVATWTVVTGVTAARWVRAALLGKDLNPKSKQAEILTKISWVSETLKRSDFNALGVRQHIHALALEGITFSPWVLNILDRRVFDADK